MRILTQKKRFQGLKILKYFEGNLFGHRTNIGKILSGVANIEWTHIMSFHLEVPELDDRKKLDLGPFSIMDQH